MRFISFTPVASCEIAEIYANTVCDRHRPPARGAVASVDTSDSIVTV